MDAKQIAGMSLQEYALNIAQDERVARYLVQLTSKTIKSHNAQNNIDSSLWEKVVLLNTYYYLRVSGKLQVDKADK